MTRVPLVIIESPYAGEIDRNVRYAKRAVVDSLAQGESPIAFHLLHTQEGILRDAIPAERERGILAGLQWTRVATRTVVYCDYGISGGMRLGIDAARSAGIPVIFRRIGCNPGEPLHALDHERRLRPHQEGEHTPPTEHVEPHR